DLVFAGPEGQLLDAANLRSREWTRLCKNAGVNGAQIYDLRHTAATELLQAGVNPKSAAALLGHASTQMLLDVYGHEPENGKAEATTRLAELFYATDEPAH